jgi:hypothetical protein
MARVLAILLVLAGLGVFLVIQNQGADRALGGALARFTRHAAAKTPAYEAPAAPRGGRDWWENEDPPAGRPVGIGQGVRERVNRAMDTGAKRAAGDQ